MIEVKNLVKRYKQLVALDHFNMEAGEGEIVALLGPNGCGKTTVINSVLGLLKYDMGEIKVMGKQLGDSALNIKRQIGLVPQEIAVFSELNVTENIDYFCGLYVFDKNKRKELVEEAIEFVGLQDFRKFTPKKLSGGLKRRLNIACGIAHRPKIIFMDEPTVAVDAQSRNFILSGVKKLKDMGSTILYTTHYLDEVEHFADRIYIVDHGKNIIDGSLSDLRSKSAIYENVEIEIAGEGDHSSLFEGLEGLMEIEKIKDTYYAKVAKGQGQTSFTEKAMRAMEEAGLSYVNISARKPSLNDIFLELTGKELRD